MNNDRRKSITEATGMLAEARAILEEARDEEQDGFVNLPESFQDGERGEAMSAAIDRLEEAIGAIEEAESAAAEASQ